MKTFWEFLNHHQPRKRGPIISQADYLAKLISQSGREGISRGRLGSLVDLEYETVNQLLNSLVQFGQASIVRRGDSVIYRAR